MRTRSRSASLTASDEVLRRHIVLVDHHHHSAGVRDEERVQVLEHRGEPGGAELAERVTEVHAALSLALEPEPVPDAQGGLHGFVAHTVRLSPPAQLVGAAEVRADLAVREAVGVVGVDLQAADAIVQLVGDRPLLHGRVPAGEWHGHRVVGRRERNAVEGRSHSSHTAVAGPLGGRRRRRSAACRGRTPPPRRSPLPAPPQPRAAAAGPPWPRAAGSSSPCTSGRYTSRSTALTPS